MLISIFSDLLRILIFSVPTFCISEDSEDSLVSLEDVLFNEAEDVYEAGPEGFILVLRLSPEPFHLVKGFEFKMLNKYLLFLSYPPRRGQYYLNTITNKRKIQLKSTHSFKSCKVSWGLNNFTANSMQYCRL